MGHVLLVAVDPAARQQLQLAQGRLGDLHFDGVPSLAEGLHHLSAATEPVDAVVIGAAVDAPVQAAQRLYAEAPGSAVLILCPAAHVDALAQALRFAPFIGRDVAYAAVEDGPALGDRLLASIQTSRSQRQLQTTVSALNARLAHLQPLQPPVSANLGRLMDAMPVGVVALDGAGRVQAWNRAAGTIFGPSERAMLGTSFADSLGPENRARLASALAIRSPGAETHLALTIPRTDGERHLDVAVTPLAGRSGERGVMLLCQDVTDRVTMEAERARLVSDLQEAVTARDTFLSIASHELKTPLTTLKLHVDVLLRTGQVPPGTALDGKLRSIRLQADRMNRLINDVLDVSRITTGGLTFEPEFLDLAEVVHEVTDHLRADCDRAGSALTVTTVPLTGCWDRFRLDQVLTNLLTNAIKFGAGQPITVSLGQDGEQAVLTVRDHGPGIAAADQGRLFQRFSRLVSSRHFGGFGLGLWIVRQIVAAMGGTIGLDSRPGEGATFTVRLPLAMPPPPVA